MISNWFHAVSIVRNIFDIKIRIFEINYDPVPELQGEPEQISKEKCKIAAKEVI